MFEMPPTRVEDRLRLVLAYLGVMSRIALLVDEPVPEGWSPFVEQKDFAKWVSSVAEITAAQAASALAALPPECATLVAPFVGGAR